MWRSSLSAGPAGLPRPNLFVPPTRTGNRRRPPARRGRPHHHRIILCPRPKQRREQHGRKDGTTYAVWPDDSRRRLWQEVSVSVLQRRARKPTPRIMPCNRPSEAVARLWHEHCRPVPGSPSDWGSATRPKRCTKQPQIHVDCPCRMPDTGPDRLLVVPSQPRSTWSRFRWRSGTPEAPCQSHHRPGLGMTTAKPLWSCGRSLDLSRLAFVS
jgi:hypothetical protein